MDGQTGSIAGSHDQVGGLCVYRVLDGPKIKVGFSFELTWKKNVACLNAWSPVCGKVGEGFGDVASLEECVTGSGG